MRTSSRRQGPISFYKMGLWLLVILLAGGSTLSGQTDGGDEVRSEIRLLREQIDRLEQRLSEMEQHKSTEASPSAAIVQDSDPVQVSAPTELTQHPRTPLDLSGFFASTLVRSGLGGPFATYQVHTASLFFGKTFGNWSFHSEMEFHYRPELKLGSIPTQASNGEVELETAWLNYRSKDWLNFRAGMLMLPTYWRLHSYPSTTMTSQAPLLYETVFPPNVAGVMIEGSKYFEDSGFTYTVYAGQGREFLDKHDNSRDAVGASLIVHLPTHHLLNTFDIGIHHYQDRIDQGRRSIWGLESRIEINRFGWLAEFAHSRVGSGSTPDLARGYYLQPSVRLVGQFFGVYRYDRLDLGGEGSKQQRHTFGMLFRPVPAVALKVEWNRYPAEVALPAQNGFAVGVSVFVR